MATRSTSEKVSSFLQWFEALDPAEQEILMTMVYKEKRIRDVVSSLGAMAQEQRQEVFQRLGLPVDLVARIPPRTQQPSTMWRWNGRTGRHPEQPHDPKLHLAHEIA